MTNHLSESSIRPEVNSMESRKLFSGLAVIVWYAVALTAAPGPRSLGRSTERFAASESPIANCADLNIRYDNRRAIVQSEERTISRAEAATLRIQAESNGGLQVEGWDQDNYSVTICKAADPDKDAESILARIHMTF